MQYFIKEKNQIKETDLPFNIKINDYNDKIFGQKITINQYNSAKIYGSVKIQKDNINYFISFNMIRREIRNKIKSYV